MDLLGHWRFAARPLSVDVLISIDYSHMCGSTNSSTFQQLHVPLWLLVCLERFRLIALLGVASLVAPIDSFLFCSNAMKASYTKDLLRRMALK